MKGKNTCRILKEIRKEIAKNNEIEYVTSECKYQGDCLGTCPKCEAEVRYLEAELDKRRKAGKTVAVAGIAAAILVSTTACGNDVAPTVTPENTPTSSVEDLGGEVPLPLQGTAAPTMETSPTPEPSGLMGGID